MRAHARVWPNSMYLKIVVLRVEDIRARAKPNLGVLFLFRAVLRKSTLDYKRQRDQRSMHLVLFVRLLSDEPFSVLVVLAEIININKDKI